MQLKYKSYLAQASFSALTNCFHGEVITNNADYLNNKISIIFLASSRQTLPAAFQQAVEQYKLSQRVRAHLS